MNRLLRSGCFVLVSIFLALLQTGSIVSASQILVADFSAAGGQGAIIRVDSDTGVQDILSSGGFFQDPVDVEITQFFRVFVADGGASAIIQVDITTGAQSIFSQGGNLISPTGIASKAPEFFPSTGSPAKPAGPVEADLWVCDAVANAVVRLDKITGAQTLIHSGAPFSDPFGIELNVNGEVFVIDRTAGISGSLFRLDGGGPTLISTGQEFRQPFGIAIDNLGRVYIADREAGGGPGAIIRIIVGLPVNANQTIVTSGGGFSEVSGLSIEVPPLARFYAVDFGAKAIIEFDPVTGDQTPIPGLPGNFNNPFRMTLVPEQPIQVEKLTWGRIKGNYR